MDETLLATWHLDALKNTKTHVIPDGCRDLIFKHPWGEKPYWFLSCLNDHTYDVEIGKGDIYTGYRLKPGVTIDESRLLDTVQGGEFTYDEICSRINCYTSLSDRLHDALNCLASGVGSVVFAAKQLGVSQRSLQRLLLHETGRPPIFWIQLARVRRAGRTIQEATSLVDIAFENGFADQSHMNREFMRWFSHTPVCLRTGIVLGGQLHARGFG